MRLATAHEAGVLRLTFDHPPTRNALDRATRIGLVDALAAGEADPDVRVIVLAGAEPAFTSGVDVTELRDPAYLPPPIDPATALRRLTTPVIAEVDGPCYSGGLEIALACSFVIASDRSSFADTHVALGLVPGWGLSAELPAAVGMARARQLSLTGLPVDAETALIWGLVNEVVTVSRLRARVAELATAIVRHDETSVRVVAALYRDGHAEATEGAHLRERSARAGQSVSPPST
jgi:enoyl-CoA hydratase